MEKSRKIPQNVLTQFVTSDILWLSHRTWHERSDNLNSKKIGSRLVELRGNKSQSEVAKAVGISDSALSMYECGERIPRDSVKVKLAQYYEKTVQSIFLINNVT